MTTREAAEKYDIPKSRVARAIKNGWLPAKKERGRYSIDEADIDVAMDRSRDCVRDGRTIVVREIVNLRVNSRQAEKFGTNAGADQFEDLFNRQGNP